MGNFLLVSTGSIAAVKVFSLLERCSADGLRAQPVLTTPAMTWLSLQALHHLSGTEPLLEDRINQGTQPLNLSAFGFILVCPASANFISKLAHPVHRLEKSIRASRLPVYLVPAMNFMMWQHPAVQRNVRALKQQGMHLIGPAYGHMACGDHGYGRMVEPDEVVRHVKQGHGIAGSPCTGCDDRALVESARLPKNFPTLHASEKKVLLLIPRSECALFSYALVSCLQSQGWRVTCAMSPDIRRLVPPEGLATLSQGPVFQDHYQEDPQGMEHIRLSERSDVLLFLAPDSAALVKLAQGSGASFLDCIYLASKKPVFLLPSRESLSSHEKELNTLRADGVTVLDPIGPQGIFNKESARAIVQNFEEVLSEKYDDFAP